MIGENITKRMQLINRTALGWEISLLYWGLLAAMAFAGKWWGMLAVLVVHLGWQLAWRWYALRLAKQHPLYYLVKLEEELEAMEPEPCTAHQRVDCPDCKLAREHWRERYEHLGSDSDPDLHWTADNPNQA